MLDTVVYLRALINPRNAAGWLLFDLSDRYVAVLSPEIIREIMEGVSRSSLRQRFPQLDDRPPDVLLAILARAEVVEPAETPRVCRDPGDDKFFACALAGGADYIVSEDRDVLAVGTYGPARTVTTLEFIEVLTTADP